MDIAPSTASMVETEHTIMYVRHPADTSQKATLYEAVCSCRRWRDQWGVLGELKASADLHLNEAPARK